MAPRPVVSVLLPVRDAAPFLDGCLASLAAQTFDDFDIVAVDDRCRDGSGEILRCWARRHRRLRIVSGRGAGLVAALADGLARCRGRFVARMDADDVAHPERLEAQVALLAERPELDVASCLVSSFPESGLREGYRVYTRWLNGLVRNRDIRRERFIESPLPHPSVLVRHHRLLETGGYREGPWPEDYELWLRMAERGCRFAKVPRVLHYWRDHESRLSRRDPRYAVERFLEVKARYLASGPLAGVRRVIVWGAGPTGRRLSKHLVRRGVALAGFLDVDPKKEGRTLRGLPIRRPATIDGRAGDGTVVVAAVASRGARALIRRRLDGGGWREGHDYWCAA